MSAAWSVVVDACISLQKVKGREEKDPDQIHEMPEESRMFNPVREPLRVGLPELRPGSPEIRVHGHPANDMHTVQPSQREIDREKVVGAGKEPEFELVAVFEILDHQEDAPEQNRRPHIHPKS